jgi:hypothetical protein
MVAAQQIGASSSAAYAERHYSVQQIANLWGLSNDAIRDLFRREPGVLAIGHDGGRGKRAYQTLRVPESVLQRVYRRFTKP